MLMENNAPLLHSLWIAQPNLAAHKPLNMSKVHRLHVENMAPHKAFMCHKGLAVWKTTEKQEALWLDGNGPV